MDKYKELDKVLAMPDNEISDDDHPDKPDISEKDYIKAMKELSQKFKNRVPEKPLPPLKKATD